MKNPIPLMAIAFLFLGTAHAQGTAPSTDPSPHRLTASEVEAAHANGMGSVGHGGGAPGMNGQLKIFPQSGYVVAVLSNLDPPAAQTIASFLDLRLGR